MLCNLDFDSNTMLLCFFLFLLIIDLYFLIPAAIVQIFNPIAELVIHIGIPSKEAKSEIEIHPESRIKLFMLLTHQFILFYFFNKKILVSSIFSNLNS